MKKTPVKAWDCAGHILTQLPKGILLTTQADGQTDTMTIGWGTIGVDWGIPVATVFVRESRYTKVLLDRNPEFTLNIPLEGMDVKKIIGFCGSKSGRDVNKFEELGLTKVPGDTVDVPGIAQLPLTLECKVIYRQDQDPKAIENGILDRFYPQGDFHTAYTAKISAAYIIEE